MIPARVILALGVVLADAFHAPSFAGNTKQGATWDEIKELPDWNGVFTWIRNPRPPMPVTARGQAQLDMIERLRKVNGDIPSRAKRCMLEGWPAGPTGPEEYSEEFVFTPGQVTMTQSQGYVRRIFTDGRKHHAGPVSYQGDSVGHWEGDTLVVDVVGMHAENEIYYGFVGGKNMHGVERIHLTDANTLAFDITIDAPDVLTASYRYTNSLGRHRDWTTVEFDCGQNQRSVDDKGNQTMILDKQSYSAGGKE